MGLSICRRIADFVGGTIEVKSEKGRGSVFSFAMPYPDKRNPQGEGTHDTASPKTAAKSLVLPDGLKALLVEDVPSNMIFMETLLRRLKVPFDACVTGEAALEKFVPGVHQLVLMDIFLPGIDGCETTRQIRNKAKDHPVWVIAQTAGVSIEDRNELLSVGIDDFVPKPIGLSFIIEAVERGIRAVTSEKSPEIGDSN